MEDAKEKNKIEDAKGQEKQAKADIKTARKGNTKGEKK